MPRKVYNANGAAAVGPYSHAVEGNIGAQTAQCFRNLFTVLAESGLTPDDVVSCSVYLTDMNDFSAMNVVYECQFSKLFPARTTIGVAALPLGACVEIGLIAARH